MKAPAGFGSRIHPEGILYPGSFMSIQERMVAGGKLRGGLGQIYDVPLGAYVSPGASFHAQVLTELMPVHPRVVGQGKKAYPAVGPLGLEYRKTPPESYTMYGGEYGGTPGYPTPKRYVYRMAGGSLGIVGAVAAVGLKAATPSITKSLKGLIGGASGKAARANRTSCQDTLVDMKKTVDAIADGTDELIGIHNAGNQVDTLQLMEADTMLQGIMAAWGQTANSYSGLAGVNLGAGLYPSSAVPFYMTGRNRMGQLYKARQSGNAPAHESDIEYERYFLRGYGVELGRTASEKRAARLGWLKTIQEEFFKSAKIANANLEMLFKAYGMTRNTPNEARAIIDQIPEKGSDSAVASLFSSLLLPKEEEKSAPAAVQTQPPPAYVPPAVQPAVRTGAPVYPSMPGMPGYEKKKSPVVPVAAAAAGGIGLLALLKVLGVF